MDRRGSGRDSGERRGADPSLGRRTETIERILGILGLPHEVDRDGPVREALVVQAHRLSRPGADRRDIEDALLALVGLVDERLVLPVRAVRLCRALQIPRAREAEEAARRAGILPFHADGVLERAGEDLLRQVEPLLSSPRRVARTAKRVLRVCPWPRQGVVDAATLRHVRRLGTGIRAQRRGAR